MPKEREKKREGEKNLRKKRERVKREGKNEFSFAQKRGGPKLTWTRVERKEETRRREEEGRLDREERRERIHCIFRTHTEHCQRFQASKWSVRS